MEQLDLSKIHQLITTMFSWPSNEEDWKKYSLTEDQINFFHENGFLSGVKMLDETQS